MTEVTHSKIERLLAEKLADSGDVEACCVDANDDRRFCDGAVTFCCDEPRFSFKGFTKEPIFETNLLIREVDDDCKFRIDYAHGILLYTRFEGGTEGTNYASGQALETELDSPLAKTFIKKAMADLLFEAATPLMATMDKVRETGVLVDPEHLAGLRDDIFKP